MEVFLYVLCVCQTKSYDVRQYFHCCHPESDKVRHAKNQLDKSKSIIGRLFPAELSDTKCLTYFLNLFFSNLSRLKTDIQKRQPRSGYLQKYHFTFDTFWIF